MSLSPALLERAQSASPWLREQLERDAALPTLASLALDSAALRQQLLDACAQTADEPGLLRALRQQRNQALARIALRDLAGLAGLDETLLALSALAEACCEAALRASLQSLNARHGQPRDEQGQPVQAVVLGMGKLGGSELNFSSDIDLIFCYTEGGQTDGAQPLSNEEFFAKCIQQFTRLLALRTEDGFVYRVDWMLRPFGSAGAPASSFDAMELYYQTHGREWERYALIKARPVAGDLAAGAQLLKTLQPFVYRRYLDYNAIGNLRDLKRMIEDEVARKGLHDNIKLGDGGIREVEFIVQALQLIRGGQDARLRCPRLRPTLRVLGETARLPAASAQALDAAYVFLRRAENALQMYGDEQVHQLPSEPARQAALCRALGDADWPAFCAALDAQRRCVRQEFQRLFKTAEAAPRSSNLHGSLASLWHGNLEREAASTALCEQGYAEGAEGVAESLLSLRRSRLVRLMREDSARKLLQLLDQVLSESLSSAQPAVTAVRALQVVQAVAGRATYLTLLRENDTARGQLLKLCAASPWLTDLLAESPALLDALLDAQALVRPPSREQMREELAQLCADVIPPLPPGEAARSAGEGTRAPGSASLTPAPLPGGEGMQIDTERGMDILRRYQKDSALRVAAADLLHGLPLVKVSDHLTWLAETIVQQAMQLAWAELAALHGEPHRSGGAKVAVAAIAYGKFGGLEMSYGSDLDLVFLHDCDALQAETQGGARPIANETWLLRYVQRVVSWLSAQTHLGRAYEVDLELRPDGRRGMTITSLSAFAQYQRQSAWTWEHQALTRARWVAGDAALGARFADLRIEVLTQARDAEKLRQDILAMRSKMRENLDKSGEQGWDVKQGPGGMIDLEFITQYLVLRDAARDARLVEYSDNWRQLEALHDSQAITRAQRDDLIRVYREYRTWLHAAALQNQDKLAPQTEFQEQRRLSCEMWTALLSAT